MTEETLHFLRPIWLWGLIVVAFIGWRLWRQKIQDGGWNQLIAAPFKPVLLTQQTEQKTALPLIGLLIIWVITLIALSGPTWQKVEVPAEKNRQASVILFDLSLSMLADDIKPNRLSRARFQLIDLLKSHPEQQFGLVVYAGSAHTITPISEDPQTLINLTPSLSPIIMPRMGANVMAGLKQAQQLLEGAHITQGHIIWITDSVEPTEINPIQQFITTQKLSLSVVTLGTESGAPIPVPNFGLLKQDNGQLVLAKLPFSDFQRLAEDANIALHPLTQQPLDTSELLPAPFIQNQPTSPPDQQTDKTLSSWLDQGIYLIWLLLPLVALSFRKGWAFSHFSLALLPLLLIGQAYPVNGYSAEKQPEAHSVSLLDVLKSNDQQGYESWQQKNYEAAANQFESPLWKGASYYRLQKYAEAIEQFKRDESAEAQFNLGNAHAQLGHFQQALDAYQKALDLRPDWQAAQQNRKLIEQLLKQQQQKSPPSPESKNTNESNNSESSSQADTENTQPNNAPNDLNQPQQTQPTQQPQQPRKNETASNSQNGQSNPAESTQSNQKSGDAETEHALSTQSPDNQKNQSDDEQDRQMTENKASPAQTESERAQQNWLNQIPHQPGLFLKRKFEYQYQQQADPIPENTKIW